SFACVEAVVSARSRVTANDGERRRAGRGAAAHEVSDARRHPVDSRRQCAAEESSGNGRWGGAAGRWGGLVLVAEEGSARRRPRPEGRRRRGSGGTRSRTGAARYHSDGG